MNDKWFQDIMKQEFKNDNYYDPTKLFLVLSLIADGEVRKEYPIKEISKNIYRLYVANPEIARKNTNKEIRNVEKYGVIDIVKVVDFAIKDFIKDQKNNSIIYLGDTIVLNLESYDKSVVNLTEQVCKILFKKYYNIAYNKIQELEEIKEIDDSNIELFGKSIFRQRLFEESQYCCLCDESCIDNLYVSHIYRRKDGAVGDELIDPNNGIILCKEDWEDYNNGKFFFNADGRVVNISSDRVVKGMRISQNLVTDERRKYLQKPHNNK